MKTFLGVVGVFRPPAVYFSRKLLFVIPSSKHLNSTVVFPSVTFNLAPNKNCNPSGSLPRGSPTPSSLSPPAVCALTSHPAVALTQSSCRASCGRRRSVNPQTRRLSAASSVRPLVLLLIARTRVLRGRSRCL